ncbi:uncharacterized protein EI97DRAFT_430150 [Westerdykella ornata]|uniref:Uncharacterized protein n=1 Tax=Westerdykella ornata TaxID=318751 RepID=A0A6A6JXG8_WESOR|nr:uncharacterized protein EI97DRAFT_430150 [Westerdykella ornata]KAF2280426.1 hypothetical protein EI97DRAFT_430150 [Westerdykella ornata]
MFCLRSWIPILFFLLRTKASPTYLVAFLVASFFLNRPCPYCSILLFILVAAIFDFHSAWFEGPDSALSDSAGKNINNTGTVEASGRGGINELGLEAASVYAQAASQTAQALLNAAVEGVKEKVGRGSTQVDGSAGVIEWVKGVWARKEMRIPCLDVLVRL